MGFLTVRSGMSQAAGAVRLRTPDEAVTEVVESLADSVESYRGIDSRHTGSASDGVHCGREQGVP